MELKFLVSVLHVDLLEKLHTLEANKSNFRDPFMKICKE